MHKIDVLGNGYVDLRNIAGPIPRRDQEFDADDTDPANAARFSFDAADDPSRLREEDLKLARYLYENRHTTPFEMIVVWLEMKMPIFIARQFVRHRTVSINEVSGRYVQLPDDFYIPEVSDVGVKSKSNKQGRTIGIASDNMLEVGEFCDDLRTTSLSAYAKYERALEAGIPNELARCYLPLNIHTKWLWKQDLHNMMHFLRLRMDHHAQFEARQYANAMHTILSGVLPETMRLFDSMQAEAAK